MREHTFLACDSRMPLNCHRAKKDLKGLQWWNPNTNWAVTGRVHTLNHQKHRDGEISLLACCKA